MKFQQDAVKLLQLEIKGYNTPEIQQRLLKIRIPCMDFLKKGSLEIFKAQLREWYARNEYQAQNIDLPIVLQSIAVQDTGLWSFEIVFNEDNLLSFIMSNGESSFRSAGGANETLNDYRQHSVSEILDNRYFGLEAKQEIDNFLRIDFARHVSKLIERKY